MSKSEAQPYHAIYVLDAPDTIQTKIMRATTDSLRQIRFDAGRPGLYNLLVIYELFTGCSRPGLEARFAGKGYAAFKRELAEAIIEGLRPLQARYRDFTADPASLDALLTAGASHIRPMAEQRLTEVKSHVGLG